MQTRAQAWAELVSGMARLRRQIEAEPPTRPQIADKVQAALTELEQALADLAPGARP